MVRIVFVYPNFSDPFSPNLGLTNLLTFINQRTKHKANLIDLTLYKKNWKKIILSYFQKNTVCLVGFTATLPTMQSSLEIARFIKMHYPNIKIIFGGVYASILKEKIFDFPEVDFSCIGEGELSLSQLLDQLEIKTDPIHVPGIYYRTNNSIITNGCSKIIMNLDELPFNNYDYWNPKIMFKFIDHLPMMASRGCQYNCTFCSQSAMHELYDNITNHNYHRLRSPKNVCDEIEFQMNKYQSIKKFKGIMFNDDTFTSNRKWVEEFCKEYRRRGLEKKYYWAINARIDNLDNEYLLMLKKAGCYYLYFGVETVNPKSQKAYKKVFDKEKVVNLTQFMHKIGISFRVYYIINGPYETLQNDLESLKMIRRIKPETFQIMPFIPLPNTKAYEIYKQTNPVDFKRMQDIFFTPLQKNKKEDNYASALVTIGIGHQSKSYLKILRLFFSSIFSTDSQKRMYISIIFYSIIDYLKKSIIYGKLTFFIDLMRYLRFLIQYKFGISDLFGFTLKRYILERSFLKDWGVHD